jgi:peptidyl-prolyl cis-trans isomerase D
MLTFIRDNVQSVAIRFIVGLVALVMLFFGVSNYSGQAINVVATVDGRDIKVEDYQRVYDQQQRNFRQRYQDRAEEVMKNANIPAKIVTALVNDVLALGSAEENGLAISDKELALTIFKTPAFQTDKRFDLEKYTNLLKDNRLDKISYEKDLKDTLLAQKYRNLLASGAAISQKWLKDEYSRYQTQVTAQILELKPEQLVKGTELTEDQLKSYYEAHQTLFMQKKMFAVKYFVLSREDLKDKVKIREKEVVKYYAKHKAKEFTTKDSFKSRHILILTPKDKEPQKMKRAKDKIEAIYQRLNKNPSLFAKLARINSEDRNSGAKGGELGWTEKGTFVPEFEKVIGTLNKGEISRPFLSSFGYHIVELQDTKPASIQPLDEVKAEIEKKITGKKAERRLKNRVAKIEKTLSANTLENTASAEQKELKQSKRFDDNSTLAELGYSYQLYQAVKSLEIGDKGVLNIEGNQKTVIYELTNIVDETVKPYDKVKAEVKLKAEEDQVSKLAELKLKELKERIKSKDQFDQITRELKLKADEVVFKVTDPKIGEVMDVKKFQLKILESKPKTVVYFSEGGQNLLVYIASKVVKASEKDDEELKKLGNELRQQKAEVLLQGLVEERKKGTEVQYNDSMLQALDIKL